MVWGKKMPKKDNDICVQPLRKTDLCVVEELPIVLMISNNQFVPLCKLNGDSEHSLWTMDVLWSLIFLCKVI